jgi:hypothetical protein
MMTSWLDPESVGQDGAARHPRRNRLPDEREAMKALNALAQPQITIIRDNLQQRHEVEIGLSMGGQTDSSV